jgi:polyhydroxybutyrate depolymerase
MIKNCFVLLFLLHGFAMHAQVVSDSFVIEKHPRLFHFVQPTQLQKNASLIFVLHGSGGSGEQMMLPAKNLQAKANAENLLIVYPDGYQHYWNECRKRAQSQANLLDINEQAFFDSMIGYFQRTYKIDPKKVFAIGFSGGGHMAYKLAMTMPQKMSGIAAIVANIPDTNNLDCDEMKKPLPVLIVNGTEDEVNPYNGGEMKVNNLSYGFVRSTDRSFLYWAKLAGYKGEPTKKAWPDKDSTDNQFIDQFAFRATNKPEIMLLKVFGGTHSFPKGIDVFEEAWQFFKRQKRK